MCIIGYLLTVYFLGKELVDTIIVHFLKNYLKYNR